MGCGCGGRNRRVAKATGSGMQGISVYSVTLPGDTEPTDYLTPLEAKRSIRRAGGGTMKITTQKAL